MQNILKFVKVYKHPILNCSWLIGEVHIPSERLLPIHPNISIFLKIA